MSKIAEAIQKIQKDCHETCILAVSKTQDCSAILEAHQAGIQHFGENYVQEAIPKIKALKDHSLIWHYIGRMQANKCKKVAQYFDWVQTIDDLGIAQKLNNANIHLAKTQNICIQINLFSEPQKAGISSSEALDFVQGILDYSHLKLQGLMTILPENLSSAQQIQAYAKLKSMLEDINQNFHLELKTLSMGMSGDYQQALAAGSTMLRLGQVIFGPRPKMESA
jgi:pyridoxal phosphate enzyme (YggS family)